MVVRFCPLTRYWQPSTTSDFVVVINVSVATVSDVFVLDAVVVDGTVVFDAVFVDGTICVDGAVVDAIVDGTVVVDVLLYLSMVLPTILFLYLYLL